MEADRVILDTSVIVDLLRGDIVVTEFVATVREVLVPPIALGELYFGAEKSNSREEAYAAVEAFAHAVRVLLCDRETARHYGRVRDALRVKGQMIPDNDLWIAAAACQHGLPLATRDQHFQRIDGLAVVWLMP